MSFLADSTAAHRDLILALGGEQATYAPVSGEAAPVLAMLDRHTAEIGEYGQTVAYRPAITVLNADVPRPEQGDRITFPASVWDVVSIANADEIISTLWVAAA